MWGLHVNDRLIFFSKVDFNMQTALYNFPYLNNLIFHNVDAIDMFVFCYAQTNW